MYGLLRSLLFLLSPETAHGVAMIFLRLLGFFPALCRWLRSRLLAGGELPVDVAGVRWPTPVGVAAGFDKDADAIRGLAALGFGAIEIGTVTPRPQPGNPRPRLFRLKEHRALINRMGFNNHGAEYARGRLSRVGERLAPIGVNLGKNKDTPLEKAADDYVACVDALAPLGDYVVLNASSPNTPGLRQLQEPQALEQLLRTVRTRLDVVAPGKPLFLKIAPDLAPEAVDQIVDVALACRIDGLIATNTTIQRPFSHPHAQQAGGLSGPPVREGALAVVRRAYARAGNRLPIIGVGGVETAEHAYALLRAGARAVQLYTGFIYGGPWIAARITRGLRALLARDGFRTVADAVGADHRG